jgi:hypothetical protein
MLRNQIVDLSAAAKASLKANTTVNAAMTGTSLIKKVSEDDKKAVGYFFRKLVRAVLSENSPKVMSMLDNPFRTWGYFDGVPRDKIEKDLEIIFDSYDLTAYDSTDLYLMDKITYSYADNSKDIILLTVPATTSGEGTTLEMILFWDSIQEFSFIRSGSSWKLISIY